MFELYIAGSETTHPNLLSKNRAQYIATRYPGPRYHRNKAFTRKTFGSGDVVADCRKVVTGTPSNDTDPWGLNINGLSEHLLWEESSWRERKRGLGERNLSLSLPRHKL